jgi:membrane protease YdiL (CAAX protease family)
MQILALLIGVGPVYILPFFNYLRNDHAIPTEGIFFYIASLGSVMIIVMLLLKYLCGERIRDLNLRPGNWRKDILVGIGLTVLTLGTLLLLRGPISDIFPGKPDSGLGDFFDVLIRNSLLFGLVVGPGLLIGAGIFEELSRVFILTRLWNIHSSKVWAWFGIVLSAVLFGSLHIYQ